MLRRTALRRPIGQPCQGFVRVVEVDCRIQNSCKMYHYPYVVSYDPKVFDANETFAYYSVPEQM
jgi:hypothetical protein